MEKLLENRVQGRLWKQWLAIGIIVLATTVVYYNSLKTPFIFDDVLKIVENPDIKELSNLKTKLVYPYSKQYPNFSRNDPSRPLTYLTFTLNYYFGKLNTFGYHLFNLVMHIFNAILLFFLTKKIISLLLTSQSPNLSISQSLTFPFFTALFFAIHPINTNAVTYIFSRSDVLATFFYILSLLFFIKTFEKNKKLYILSLLCFIVALFSKQIAVTLPAIVLISDYIFLNNFSIKKTIDKKYYHIPFWALLFIYLLSRYFYLGGLGDVEVEVTKVWNRYSYLIIQPDIILRYLKLLFIPIGFCIEHRIEPAKILELKTIISFLSLAVIFWLTYRTYKKKTDISKIILFCVLWFFIILSPTSSFFPTTSPLVENRLYLSGFGFYFFITFLYFKIFKINFALGKEFNLTRNWLFNSIITFHIFLLGYGTIKRNQLYQQPILMWQDVISKYPNNVRAHSDLGILLYNSKRYENAEKEYREAIRIDQNYAEAHNNLGNLLYDSKRYEEAEQEYRQALRVNPNNAKAHNNLGNLLYNSKRYEEAERAFRDAIRVNPNFAGARYNLGILLHNLKRYEEAEKAFSDAIRVNPDNAKAYNNLGGLLYNSKRFKEAEKAFRDAIRINPNFANAHNNLGILLHNLKRYEEAEKEYREAIGINPNDVELHNNLGILYYELKKYNKALQEYETALRLSPNNKLVQDKIQLLHQLKIERK
ncbi:MAG: tetratricopeptide repeat protein [Elusimicrobiota bacterium]